MEQMFKAVFERLIDIVSVLIVTGLIVGWTIDLQRKAAKQKKIGLISLTRVTQELMKKDK